MSSLNISDMVQFWVCVRFCVEYRCLWMLELPLICFGFWILDRNSELQGCDRKMQSGLSAESCIFALWKERTFLQSRSDVADFFLCFMMRELIAPVEVFELCPLGFGANFAFFAFLLPGETPLRIVVAISLRAEERSRLRPSFTSRPSNALIALRESEAN